MGGRGRGRANAELRSDVVEGTSDSETELRGLMRGGRRGGRGRGKRCVAIDVGRCTSAASHPAPEGWTPPIIVLDRESPVLL